MRPRRIAIVAPHFAEYSERLAAGFAAQVPTWIAVNRSNHAAEVTRSITGVAHLAVMPMDRRPHQALALVRCGVKAALFRADVVIVQEGVRQLLKPLVWLLKRFTHVALVVHDPKLHSGTDSAQSVVQLPYRQWLRRHADVIIVHGEACRSEMVGLGFDQSRIVAINHGVLMVPAHPPAIAPEPRRALMFGRMEAYKGLEVLLAAVALLKARGVALHLVVAGAGPEQARLAGRMAELGVEAIDRYLSPDELEHELARAAFVLAPYVDATQSGVLASAFGNGRPAIASNVGGLGDVVSHGVNGLLVPPSDPAALADAMATLLEDPTMTDTLAKGAQRFAATALDWGHIARALLDDFSTRKRQRRALRTASVAAAAMLALLLMAAAVLLVRAAPAWARNPAKFDAPACSTAGRIVGAVTGKAGEPPVADMYGTSELRPAGAFRPDGRWMTWALYPRVNRGHVPPPGWPSMVPWGQVFISERGDISRNTRVEVRNLRLFVRPQASGAWCRLLSVATPRGAFYRTDFAGNTHDDGDQRTEPGGGRSFKPEANKAIHFYSNHAAIPAEAMSGVYSDFEARLISDDPKRPDDSARASLVASAGADYWATDQWPPPPLKQLADEVGIGRFRRVTTRWQVFSMNTAAPGVYQRPR